MSVDVMDEEKRYKRGERHKEGEVKKGKSLTGVWFIFLTAARTA